MSAQTNVTLSSGDVLLFTSLAAGGAYAANKYGKLDKKIAIAIPLAVGVIGFTAVEFESLNDTIPIVAGGAVLVALGFFLFF